MMNNTTTPERPNVDNMKIIKALNTIVDELKELNEHLEDIENNLRYPN